MSHQQPQDAEKIRRLLLITIEVLASIVLIVMMLQVVINAISRTVWREPLFGTLEVTQFYYLPILALLGLAAAQARNEHIVADLLFDSFPPLARRVTTVIVNVLSGVITGLIGWFAIAEFLHALERGVTAGNTDIQVWPVHLFMAICYAIFTIQLLWVAFLTASGQSDAQHSEADADEVIAGLDSLDPIRDGQQRDAHEALPSADVKEGRS